MKTTCICPTCGAVLDIDDNTRELVCEYCGHKLFINEDGSTSTKKVVPEKSKYEKELFSSLVKRKFIYYIPHFDGINDCYDFILDYAEAVYLFKKKAEDLSFDEVLLIKKFFEDGHKYIYECTLKNVGSMIYTQKDKYRYAFKVIDEAEIACCNFADLEDLLKEEILATPPEVKKAQTTDKEKRKLIIIIVVVVFVLFVLPGLIGLIIGLL